MGPADRDEAKMTGTMKPYKVTFKVGPSVHAWIRFGANAAKAEASAMADLLDEFNGKATLLAVSRQLLDSDGAFVEADDQGRD